MANHAFRARHCWFNRAVPRLAEAQPRMTYTEAIQLTVDIVSSAALAGFTLGFAVWFLGRPEKR